MDPLMVLLGIVLAVAVLIYALGLLWAWRDGLHSHNGYHNPRRWPGSRLYDAGRRAAIRRAAKAEARAAKNHVRYFYNKGGRK